MLNRLGWALSGALALLAVLALARATVAGPLDPPGPVGSTMRTLDELLPSWGKNLTSAGGCNSQRFQCVMALNEAVLDRETGLVWQRTPDNSFKTYDAANGYCHFTALGGRYGWRLPTLTELWSLADDSGDDNIPDGSPFINVGGGVYWSSTLWEDDQYVVTLAFFGGFLEELTKGREGASEFSNTWCVRSGQSVDDDPRYAEQPAWSRTLSAEGGCEAARFDCVMNDEAVLDRETGLVWERVPTVLLTTWDQHQIECGSRSAGGRRAWRAPTLSEAMSLLDPSVGGSNELPVGHPFQVDPILVNRPFATSSSRTNTIGYGLYLDGSVAVVIKTDILLNWARWCVRGVGGEDGP